MNFSFDTFLVTISDFPFLFCKIQNFNFGMQIKKQHDAVRKLLGRIQNIKTLWNES